MAGTSLEKHDAHGEVEAAHGGAVVSYNPDAPSEEWGWHGTWQDFAPKGKNALLGLGAAGLLLMIIGNHRSNVENYFLIAFALGMVLLMVQGYVQKKKRNRIRP
ncbi:DUF2631 domain-containing protein [Nakamurella alba]|uniref:DUF2631 domain-containing protein n=1 Tax=Nakamurella alba TaxID=2665158 RepID=UPI0018AAABE6|nr:DUF2631 domain-containing protein [Nakamurella alba]